MQPGAIQHIMRPTQRTEDRSRVFTRRAESCGSIRNTNSYSTPLSRPVTQERGRKLRDDRTKHRRSRTSLGMHDEYSSNRRHSVPSQNNQVSENSSMYYIYIITNIIF